MLGGGTEDARNRHGARLARSRYRQTVGTRAVQDRPNVWGSRRLGQTGCAEGRTVRANGRCRDQVDTGRAQI